MIEEYEKTPGQIEMEQHVNREDMARSILHAALDEYDASDRSPDGRKALEAKAKLLAASGNDVERRAAEMILNWLQMEKPAA